jgi:hypothetical protein
MIICATDFTNSSGGKEVLRQHEAADFPPFAQFIVLVVASKLFLNLNNIYCKVVTSMY